MPSFINGIVGGFVATIVMTIAMMAMTDDSPPPTALLWAKYIGNRGPDEYMMQGMILHFIYGILAGGVFVLVANTIGLDLVSLGSSILWAVVYGVMLFLIGAGFWMPRVLDMQPDRQMAVGFLLFHVVYGIVLGAWVSFELL